MINILFVFLLLFFFTPGNSYAVSELFPPVGVPPFVSDFLANPLNTYYCSPSGDNSTGDGTIGNPWLNLAGASAVVAPGSLIYLRGGSYADAGQASFAYSNNNLAVSGTVENPIVVTNYPGEIAVFTDGGDDSGWLLTLQADYVKLIGTLVGSSYGIQIDGGATVSGDFIQVSGVDFLTGIENGGDYNPSMLSVPVNDTTTNTVISHNTFRDSIALPTYNRNTCIRLFSLNTILIEYNLFIDNRNLYQGGSIYYKGAINNATVRYNKFINCVGGISYAVQGDEFNGSIYENLFYSTDNPFYFTNDLTNSGEISIYNNVALSIPVWGAFFMYLNSDNQEWSVHGDFYNNVIDGLAFELSDNANSDDIKNFPDIFNYNLWIDASDKTILPIGPPPNDSGVDISSLGYYANDIVAVSFDITYDEISYTAIASESYPGRGLGINGTNIGGFLFSQNHGGGSFSGMGNHR